jgi:hypothetical protein
VQHTFVRALACAALLATAPTAGAVIIEWEDLGNQGPLNSISLSSGGITATGEAFGGLSNPQNTITKNTAPGATNIQVNIGGSFQDSNTFGLRGLGCGIAQCDLIAPIGEDAVRITFSQGVQLDTVVLSAMEGPDDVTWWYWGGGQWNFAGQDTCSGVSCSGQETWSGPFGASRYWLFVAENSGASAFRIAELHVTAAVPGPAGASLLALAGALAALRRVGSS